MMITPVELLFKLNALDSVRFISIRNYRNAKGELSNYVLIAAATYGNAVKKDIERLKRVRYRGHKEAARKQMLETLIKNQNSNTRSAASQAQNDAYAKLGQNSRVHIDSRLIRVWAFVRSKHIIEPGNYRATSLGIIDRCKNEIKAELRLSHCNFRQFKLENIKSCCMMRQTLEISI